jgi:hypothetical protein
MMEEISSECGVWSAECRVMGEISSDSGSKTSECGVRSAECGMMEEISSEFGARSTEHGIWSATTPVVAECGVRSEESGVMEDISSDCGDVTSDDSPAYSSQCTVTLDVSSDCWITGFITPATLLPDCDIGRSEEYGTMLLFPVSARTSKVENISSIPSLFREFTGPAGGSAGI